MGLLRAAAAIAGLWLCASAHPALAACSMKEVFRASVTLVDGHPTIPVQLNGETVDFMVDSGASRSTIDLTTAKSLKLPLSAAPANLVISGVGGKSTPQQTMVSAVTIAGASFSDSPFLVQPLSGMNLLGQTLLGYADAEYDLPHDSVRVIKATDCAGETLAYWAAASQAISVTSLEAPGRGRVDRTIGPATINGQRMRAVYDTGSPRSVLTLAAAARAGITPDSPGVAPGQFVYGAGDRTVRTWSATFASVNIGGEVHRNVRLLFGDLPLGGADMLLGVDFFQSHRVYVANSQHRIYITYEGGPVFDQENAAGPGPREVSVTVVGGSTPVETEANPPKSPVDPARKGAGRAAADPGRTGEQTPDSAEFAYRRANAHIAAKQIGLAMADLDQALRLEPSMTSALILRARLRLAERDRSGAVEDLDSATAAITAPQDDRRLTLGDQYRAAGRQDLAVSQYDQWISAHPADRRMAQALFGRCRSRAVEDSDLALALADCNRAASLAPKAASVLSTRGLIRLKTGDYARAVTDYDAAIGAEPQDALALYGRGLARLRLGKTAQGRSDLAAAAALEPGIADQAQALGLPRADQF